MNEPIKHGIGVVCLVMGLRPGEFGYPQMEGWYVTINGPAYIASGERCWLIEPCIAPARGAAERVLFPVPPLSELEGEKRDERIEA